jgi:Asp-tRNA(Asn)/Glu-tRNA(Gln) amidotransferase C subunit
MPTITIELTKEQADRLFSAMEEVTGYSADIEAVNNHLVEQLRGIVSRGEKQKADRLAAKSAAFDVTCSVDGL